LFDAYTSVKLAHCPISGLETGYWQSMVQRTAEKTNSIYRITNRSV